MYKFIIFLFILNLAFACNQEEGVRQYVETGEEQPASESRTEKRAEQTDLQLNWTIPDGWIERKGGGMRLATFIIGGEKSRTSCTIVSLKGNGGGITANIRRWLGQLSLSAKLADEAALTRFISDQWKIETSAGLTGLLVDFTSLTDSPDSQSMLVTVFQFPDQTVFVKLMEKKSILNKTRDDYMKLVNSFGISKGKAVEKN